MAGDGMTATAYDLGHRVEWTVDKESITGLVICENGPQGWCHLVCPNGCEEFSFDGHEHPLTYGDECNVELWLNADCPTLTYEGEERIGAGSGPIRTIWHRDYYGWVYAADSVATADVSQQVTV